VPGVHLVDIVCREPVECLVEGVDGFLVAIVEPGVHRNRTERRQHHVSGEQDALAVDVRPETEVFGLVARCVNHVERDRTDLDGLAASDPVIDRLDREELAVALQRVDRHLDGLIEVLPAQARGACVLADGLGQPVGVACEPVVDAVGGVQRGVCFRQHCRYLPDVVDVGVCDHQMLDVGDVVAVFGQAVDQLLACVLARHDRVDQNRLTAIDQIGRNVPRRPVDTALDPVDCDAVCLALHSRLTHCGCTEASIG